MSALARYFSAKGISVSGYDKARTALTAQLEKEGVKIHYEDNIDLADKDADLAVYTPAIPKDHRELNYYQQRNYPLVKRSDVLEEISNNSFNICVAGTHGKTTISAMIAHILRDSGYGCNAFLGGISANYNTNFWSSENDVCVIEADEFDRSFLKLKPDVAVISAMDADHLDIYGTLDAMQDAFVDFSGKIKKDGLLISKYGLKKDAAFSTPRHLRYCLQNTSADAYASDITASKGGYRFTVSVSGWSIDNMVLQMGGMHNVENAVAAISVAHHLQIDKDKIRSAIGNFKGVKRRFEYIIKTDSLVFIDDYAHHPEELRALISSARNLFSDRRCTVIFQPHLFTRTRDFAKEFAEVLDIADEVILLPIYPARELPVEGVSSELILNEMKNKNKSIKTKEQVLDFVKEKTKSTLFITAGAGDIDGMVAPLKQIIQGK